MFTAAPDWVADAFQICEIACAPGQLKPTVQPVIGAVPAVTVKPSWKPPDQELTTDQATVQAPPEMDVEVGVGEAVVGVGDAVVGVGDAVVGVGEAVVGVGDAVVGVGLGVGDTPVPFVRTTTDSAGTDTDPPDSVDDVIVGDAAEYTSCVSDALVMPSDDVDSVYPFDGSALTSMTAYLPPGSWESYP